MAKPACCRVEDYPPPMPHHEVMNLIGLLALAEAGAAIGHDPTQWMTDAGRAYWKGWLEAKEAATAKIKRAFHQ